MTDHIIDEPRFSKEEEYFHKANFITRMKSTVLDSFVIVGLMILVSIIVESLKIESGIVRGVALGLIFLYEPILVTFGKTIGQKIFKLKVVRKENYIRSKSRTNINPFASLGRFAIKIFLGWISLLTIHSDVYGQAIHDRISGSLMINE